MRSLNARASRYDDDNRARGYTYMMCVCGPLFFFFFFLFKPAFHLRDLWFYFTTSLYEQKEVVKTLRGKVKKGGKKI